MLLSGLLRRGQFNYDELSDELSPTRTRCPKVGALRRR
jgi:hypothetical protein